MARSDMDAAKTAKQDEFYTQWADIEREMNAYLEYDPDVFRGKTILLPCDDPEWSNFTKYFALHFTEYGLKKLISTSYAPASNAGGAFYMPTLSDDPQFDPEKDKTHGKIFTLVPEDLNRDGRIDVDDLRWDYLDGDGDFRSTEVTALRDEADIVITNPPFSLLRSFVAWLVAGKVRFSIVGSVNAATYKEIFPLVERNVLWKGATANSTDMVFEVPEGVEVTESDQLKAAKLGYPSTETKRYTRLGNSCWFTNVEHGRRHEPLRLMTMADNKKYSRHKDVQGHEYRHFDNYDALEVSHVDAIPSDYAGVMGVPITFLDRYNPEQFEIVGIAKAPMGRPTKRYPQQTQISAKGVRSRVTKLNDGPAIEISGPIAGKTYYEVNGGYFVQVYARILIRHRNPASNKD